jgi:P-type Cu2+ transporter
MRQNPTWAVGYNSLAIPLAAGILEPAGFILSPAVAALSMSGSSIIVAVNSITLKRLQLTTRLPGERTTPAVSERTASTAA